MFEKIWMAVSTHEGEHEEIKIAHDILKNRFPKIKLVVCPRHPKQSARFKAIFEGDSSVCFNETLGNMEPYFQQADIVLMGGTFNPRIGGHNILEPISYQKPVIVGPYTDKINDLVAYCGGGVLQVKNGTELGVLLVELFENDLRRKEVAEFCYAAYLKAREGVLESYMSLITPLIDAQLQKPPVRIKYWFLRFFEPKISLRQLRKRFFPRRYLWRDWRYWVIKPMILWRQLRRKLDPESFFRRPCHPGLEPGSRIPHQVRNDKRRNDDNSDFCFITAMSSQDRDFKLGLRLLGSMKGPVKILDCGLSVEHLEYLNQNFQVEIKRPQIKLNPRNLVENYRCHKYPDQEISREVKNPYARTYFEKYASVFPGFKYYVLLNLDVLIQDSEWFNQVLSLATKKVGRMLLKKSCAESILSAYIHDELEEKIIFIEFVKECPQKYAPESFGKIAKSLALIPTSEAEDILALLAKYFPPKIKISRYPDYGKSWEKSKALHADDLKIDLDPEKYQTLNKFFIFPVRSRRKTVVIFCDALLRKLEKNGWHIVDSDTENIQRRLTENKCDIAVFYMTNMSEDKNMKKSTYFYKNWENFENEKFVKIFISEDIHNSINIESTQFLCHHVDAVAARYPEALCETVGPIQKPVYLFPHAASPEFLRNSRNFEAKTPKLLVSGALHLPCYPLRKKALELFHAGKYPIDLKPHLGYKTLTNPGAEANEYAASIASYQLALTGVLVGESIAAPYVLAKHFEIPAAGTVMVTDKLAAPLLEPLGFVEGVNYLTTTPDSLAEDLKLWLSAPEALEKIALAGQNLVLERHTLDQRVFDLEKIAWHTFMENLKIKFPGCSSQVF